MRVFILCTGRTGSSSFIKACEHITNYTAGHESRSKLIGASRFDYPDKHIEADNRLSWFLGTLDQRFGKDAYYVHLTRDKQKVVDSFKHRWNNQGSIIKSFTEGILMQGYKKITEEKEDQIIHDYVDTVNNNIIAFLKDKPNKIDIQLETIKEDFLRFFSVINAEGDAEAAIKTFLLPTNTKKESEPGLVNWIKNKLNN